MRRRVKILVMLFCVFGCGKTSINVAHLGGGGEGANVAPVAGVDTRYTMSSGALFAIDVLSNDSDPDGDAISINNVSAPSKGTAVVNGTNIDYTPTASQYGLDSFTYTIIDSQGNISNGTINVYHMTAMSWWGNGGDTNWDTPANWCKAVNAGRTGCDGGTLVGDVPGVGDNAYFHDGCTSCDANVNLNISLNNLYLLEDYTGTLTQNATRTITISSTGDFLVNGGTFAGGDSLIQTDEFRLYGGTVVFNGWASAAGGTVVLTIDVPTTATFNNLTFDVRNDNASNYATLDLSAGDTLIVAGDLVFNNGRINNGTIEVSGDLTVNCPTFATRDCAWGGSTNVVLNGAANQNITQVVNGTLPGSLLDFDNAAGFTLLSSIDLATMDIALTNGTIDMQNNDFLGIDDITDATGTVINGPGMAAGDFDYVTCLGGAPGAPCPTDDL